MNYAWPIQDIDDDALDALDRPPERRSDREVERLDAILDKIAAEDRNRRPLEVEMLVSSDARRDEDERRA